MHKSPTYGGAAKYWTRLRSGVYKSAVWDLHIRRRMNKYAVFLDIDQTSFYGQDGNDVPNCLQIDKRYDILPSVVSLLVNPAMIAAVRELEGKLGTVRIVLYTAKYDLPVHIPADSKFRVDSNDIYFPAHTHIRELPVFPDKSTFANFNRLFLVRDAICAHLDRVSVEMFVTSRPGKCVVRTCGMIHPAAEPENTYLFDDRVDLAGTYHVITIPAFNSLAEESKDAIYALVGTHRLSERAVAFAKTAQEEHSCLGEADRIRLNWSRDPPKQWCLSFLDTIECVVFRFVDLWGEDDGLEL